MPNFLSTLKTFVLHITAVRTVSAGHKMVSDGWAAFENACANAGPGELPQLLRSLKGKTNPSPPCRSLMPIKQEPMDVYNQVNGTSQDMSPTTEKPIRETPIAVRLEGHKYQYRCGNCDIAPTATSRAMDSHIRAVHTKKAFLCSYCDFTTYNLDSMQRHEKSHK